MITNLTLFVQQHLFVTFYNTTLTFGLTSFRHYMKDLYVVDFTTLTHCQQFLFHDNKPTKVIKAAFSLSEILVFGTKPVLKYENENLSNWNLATFSVISSREGELNPNLNVNKKSFC